MIYMRSKKVKFLTMKAVEVVDHMIIEEESTVEAS